MTWLFDAHIHLSDPAFVDTMCHTIKNMEKMQIKACCVSMDVSNSHETLTLAKQSKLILPFIGIHPEKATDDLEKMNNLIENNLDAISGIGEIGLDRTYVDSEDGFQRQKFVFESLMSAAEKYQKPVSVHSRKTLDDLYEIIPSYSNDKILLHWFDGSKKQLQKAMDLNLYVSFGPVMVYANDKQTLLKKTNPDKILVETDGPVAFSKCFGFKPAQISFIPSVVFCASKLLHVAYDELCQTLEDNSKRYLGI